jgi:TolB protein
VSDAGRALALTIDHDIVIASADLGTRKVIASAPGFDWHPRFSPDGKWLLFESARASFRDLYKLEIDTGALLRLTDDREGNFDGAWSPDGARIAFASSRHGQLDLFVMNADGSGETRLTRHPGDAIKPAWSADGRYLAYLSGRDARDELYVVRPDGTGIEKVGAAPAGGRVERFMWHPTEPRLVFAVRTADAGSKLHVARVDVRRSWRLSKKTDDDFDPVWSPDGSRLLFVSKKDGRSRLQFVREDGSERMTLEVGVDDVWLPRWFEIEKVGSR